MRLEESNVTGTSDPVPARGSFLEVLGVFARLGLTSFGGPIAHLGYFRQEIVVRRKWLDDPVLPVVRQVLRLVSVGLVYGEVSRHGLALPCHQLSCSPCLPMPPLFCMSRRQQVC